MEDLDVGDSGYVSKYEVIFNLDTALFEVVSNAKARNIPPDSFNILVRKTAKGYDILKNELLEIPNTYAGMPATEHVRFKENREWSQTLEREGLLYAIKNFNGDDRLWIKSIYDFALKREAYCAASILQGYLDDTEVLSSKFVEETKNILFKENSQLRFFSLADYWFSVKGNLVLWKDAKVYAVPQDWVAAKAVSKKDGIYLSLEGYSGFEDIFRQSLKQESFPVAQDFSYEWANTCTEEGLLADASKDLYPLTFMLRARYNLAITLQRFKLAHVLHKSISSLERGIVGTSESISEDIRKIFTGNPR